MSPFFLFFFNLAFKGVLFSRFKKNTFCCFAQVRIDITLQERSLLFQNQDIFNYIHIKNELSLIPEFFSGTQASLCGSAELLCMPGRKKGHTLL